MATQIEVLDHRPEAITGRSILVVTTTHPGGRWDGFRYFTGIVGRNTQVFRVRVQEGPTARRSFSEWREGQGIPAVTLREE